MSLLIFVVIVCLLLLFSKFGTREHILILVLVFVYAISTLVYFACVLSFFLFSFFLLSLSEL